MEGGVKLDFLLFWLLIGTSATIACGFGLLSLASVFWVAALEGGLHGFVGLIDGSLEDVEAEECLSTSKIIR